MDSDKENDLMELKTELATVVEALSVLNDFIESIFGAKYHNFMSTGCQGGTEDGSYIEVGTPKNIQSALRRLRWKHSKSEEDTRGLSTPPSIGGASKGDNGYASAGGTPTTAGGDEGRRDSASSQNQMFSPTTQGGNTGQQHEDRGDNEDSCRFSLGRPEIIAVKCEVSDTDFLDDMDPFGDEPGEYHYEGEDSELKIEDCYPLSSSAHLSNEDNPSHQQAKSPTMDLPNSHSNSSPRFIPELIPIKSDPLHQNAATTLVGTKDDESGTASSDNSDSEWHPSSTFSSAPSKRKTSAFLSKATKRPSIQPERISISNFTPSLPGNLTVSRQPPNFSMGAAPGDAGGTGGPFKCDMCPASYKQEESLRSHQKYKHNPSRVTQKCNICNKTMVDKYRLQRHLRLHTGEKPFECEYCGQSFYRKDYHTKHLQRKHGISYTAPAPSKIIRKPMGKPKPTISSSSSPYSISSSSSVSSSSFQSFRAGVFETPSPPPPLVASSCGRSLVHRHSFTSTNTTSPSSSSTSPAAMSSLTTSASEITVKQQPNFVDVFPSHFSGQGGGGYVSNSDGSEYCSNTGGIGNLMTMTSLTFDDLISADL